MKSPLVDRLLAKIRSHDALVGIIGMGYVGLPLMLAFVERGFNVIGFDVDAAKVAQARARRGLHQAYRQRPAAAAAVHRQASRRRRTSGGWARRTRS